MTFFVLHSAQKIKNKKTTKKLVWDNDHYDDERVNDFDSTLKRVNEFVSCVSYSFEEEKFFLYFSKKRNEKKNNRKFTYTKTKQIQI